MTAWVMVAAAIAGGLGYWSRAFEEAPESLQLQVPDDSGFGLHSRATQIPDEVVLASAPRAVPDDAVLAQGGEQLNRYQKRLRTLAKQLDEHPVPTCSSPDSNGPGNVKLEQGIERIVDKYKSRADIAVHIRDLQGRRVLYDHIGEQPLNPASNQKLITSAAALDVLGPAYVFETKLRLKNGVLFVVGEGDPTLVTARLEGIADEVIRRGWGPKINRIVVDGGVFSDRRFGPGYSLQGPGYAYQAPSGALSLNFNTIEVVASSSSGERPRIKVIPPNDHIELQNYAWVRGASRSLRMFTEAGEDGKTVLRITGNLPKGAHSYRQRRRVMDPALFTGSALAQMLAERMQGVAVPVSKGAAPSDVDESVVFHSVPLFTAVDSLLTYSNNFGAEQLVRTLGWRLTEEPGGWGNGEDVLKKYWSAIGRSPEQLVLENGSGLSLRGRVSAVGLVDVISVAHYRQARGESLIDAMTSAGEPGTMRTRLRGFGHRVRAKTGTLSGVSALSGVVLTEEDSPHVAFSVLINSHGREGDGSPILLARYRRAIEDAIVTRVVEHVDEPSETAGIAGQDCVQ